MKLPVGTAALALLICCDAATGAQPFISLTFKDGYVWLIARDAPVPAILREWARLGGARIVNAEDVEGEPVTLKLDGVPERAALDVVLRNVAGYVLAPRAAGSAGASVFDRVHILPTTSAPASAEVAHVSVGRPRVPARALGRLNRAGEAILPEPLAAILRSGVTGFTLPTDLHADSEPPAPDSNLPEPLETAIRSGLTGPRAVPFQLGDGVAADVDVTVPQ